MSKILPLSPQESPPFWWFWIASGFLTYSSCFFFLWKITSAASMKWQWTWILGESVIQESASPMSLPQFPKWPEPVLWCGHVTTLRAAWGKEEKLPPFATKTASTFLKYFSPAFFHIQAINYLSLPKERNRKGNQTFKEYKLLYSLFSEIMSQFYHEQSWL